MMLRKERNMKLKQKCVKNKYKLSFTFMRGDADGYKTEHIMIDKYEGTYLEELTKLMNKWMLVASKGLSGRECEKLRETAVLDVLNNPVVKSVAVKNEEFALDHVSDFLFDLGYRWDGDSGIPLSPDSIELTFFDNQGDEYTVFENDTYLIRKGK